MGEYDGMGVGNLELEKGGIKENLAKKAQAARKLTDDGISQKCVSALLSPAWRGGEYATIIKPFTIIASERHI